MTSVMTFSRGHAPATPLLHKSFGTPEPDVVRNTASVARVVEEALTLLGESAMADRVTLGVRIRSANIVETALDWAGFTISLQRMSKYLGGTIKSYARREIREASAGNIAKADDPTVSIATAFTAVDALSIAYAEKHTGELIAGITANTRDNVRTLVGESLQGNLTVDQLQRRLRDFIPLAPSDVKAVDNYYAKQFARLIEEGNVMDDAVKTASSLTSKYGARKLKDRATTIARTELTTAANKGRYAGWEGSVTAGISDPKSIKEWVAAASACDICRALDGQMAYWDAEFPNGMLMPPDHPRCRCSAVLLPPDDDIIAEMERQFSSANVESGFTDLQARADSAVDMKQYEMVGRGQFDYLPYEPGSPADKALTKYITDDDWALRQNAAFRAGKAPSGALVDGMDEAITQNTLVDHVELWRGLALTEKEAAAYAVGADVDMVGWASTTGSRTVADFYATERVADAGGDLRAYTLRLIPKAGTHAALGSGEVILERNTSWKVISVKDQTITLVQV